MDTTPPLSIGRSFILALSILLPMHTAHAIEVFDNGLLRFGTGSENSVNTEGTLQQPFYYDTAADSWYQLTFSSYPLDAAIGVGGDGSNSWNINGTVQANPVLAGQVIDVSGFTATSASSGYGTIVSTGTVTIDGTNLEVENTYTLQQDKSFITATTKITNTSGGPVSNLRLWVGTRDDFVGLSDLPEKERGNLVNGAFEILTDATDQSVALRIKTATTGVLFYSTSPNAQTSISNCCSFSNAYSQDPDSSVISVTNDGSYALYIRMADLADGESDELTWYYAAGQLSDLDDIVSDVAAASAINKALDEDTVVDFSSTDFVDSSDVTFEKIRISSLPANGTLKLAASPVSLNQEILQADYANFTYTPDANFNGADSFGWQAWDSTNSVYLNASSVNLTVNPVNDAPAGSVTIDGVAAANEIITADTSNLVDVDGLGTFSYQWKRGNTNIGSDSPTYTLLESDLSTPVTVTVSYTDADGTDESVISEPFVGDTDGDGVPDALETADADNDGIPDYLDIADAESGLHGGDSDGDGIPDAAECPDYPACPDTDSDGVADYLDVDNATISNDVKPVTTSSSGVGSLDLLYLSAIPVLIFMCRRRKFTKLLLLSMVAFSAQAETATEMPVANGQQNSGFYFGLSMGQSILEPDVNGTVFDIEDDTDTAGGILLGYQFSQDLQAEISYMELGQSDLSTISTPVGAVEYRVANISGVYKLYSLSQYGYPVTFHVKGGYAKLNNSADVPYDKDNTGNLSLGLFAQYNFAGAAGIRLGLDSFGDDSAFLGISMVMYIP